MLSKLEKEEGSAHTPLVQLDPWIHPIQAHALAGSAPRSVSAEAQEVSSAAREGRGEVPAEEVAQETLCGPTTGEPGRRWAMRF